ncbi:MAG: SMP-30/gluconolactonase/LRE family protein [Minwuia sp.]|uniref:SMP-30/gluconolactonase/LRE family protein n=1 Tax=Minwuia sp. TaxID=2493630 RepID=UPI003A864BE7
MTDFRVVTEGLRFPEGPIALPDGDVLVVEIAAGRLTRVHPDGSKTVVAQPGGGPNGAAMGPDGKCYVCNNGGFRIFERDGRLFPLDQPDDYSGGRIERIDIETGEVEVLYTHCDGVALKGPNDIVFDKEGGFWFTDHGKMRKRDRDTTGVYYALADGSKIVEAIFPSDGPNGIGLSPAEDELYVAETHTGRLWAYPLSGPGQLASPKMPMRGPQGRLVVGLPGHQLFDSLAVDGAGNVCVATIHNGGITVVPPDGSHVSHVPMPDAITTNICFGGEDLTTAYITLSSTGKLVAMDWPRPGLALNFLNK